MVYKMGKGLLVAMWVILAIMFLVFIASFAKAEDNISGASAFNVSRSFKNIDHPNATSIINGCISGTKYR